MAVGVPAIRFGKLDPRLLIGLRLVERLALEQRAGQCLEPPALAPEELDHVVLGAVDDSADLLVDQLLGRVLPR